MFIEVEIHRNVLFFLKYECSSEERAAFNECLGRVRGDLIGLSEAITDPTLSRYMLRFFRFARCIAIFETNRARDRIRVRKCQRLLPRDEGK